MRIRMIDPPNGHDFGFPKPLDGPDGMDIDEWLLANGYPKHEIDKFPGGVPCRVYYVERRSVPST